MKKLNINLKEKMNKTGKAITKPMKELYKLLQG